MNKFLINIPDDERTDGRTRDADKYRKDCDDFVCLDDGTIMRDCRYCNLSTVCRQVDVLPNGEVVPMEANYMPITEITFNDAGQPSVEVKEWQYFCTGMHDLRPLKERIEDDKVS